MSSDPLYRLAERSTRRPWLVIATWLIAAAAVVLAAGAVGRPLEDSFRVEGLDSQQANDLLASAGTGQDGLTAQAVLTPRDRDTTFRDSAARTAVQNLQRGLAGLSGVVAVGEPLVSLDGRVALLRVQYPTQARSSADDLTALKAFAASESGGPLRIELGGDLFFAFEQSAGNIGEALGLLLAAVVLLVAFGSVVAAALPLVTAIVGLAVGVGALPILARVVDVPSWAPVLASMVGLGVGIDYALFIITRHRELLRRAAPTARGGGPAPSRRPVGRSCSPAAMVVVSVLGLAVAGVGFLTGGAIRRSRWWWLVMVVGIRDAAARAADGLSGRFVLLPSTRPRAVTRGRRLDALGRTRHAGTRWRTPSAPPLVLLALAAPAMALRSGIPDDGALPATRTERQAYNLVAQVGSVRARTGRWWSPSTCTATPAIGAGAVPGDRYGSRAWRP